MSVAVEKTGGDALLKISVNPSARNHDSIYVSKCHIDGSVLIEIIGGMTVVNLDFWERLRIAFQVIVRPREAPALSCAPHVIVAENVIGYAVNVDLQSNKGDGP